ncbi:MAG: hypothetical protein FJ290_00840 [Planctomycetes bacterium]|nr:hypothetical protein [Planctomycetota bacterium]
MRPDPTSVAQPPSAVGRAGPLPPPNYDGLLAAVGYTWGGVARLGRHFARRLRAHPNDVEDAVAVFVAGVLWALPRVEPEQQAGRAYVVKCGLGFMRRHLRRERRHWGCLSLDAPTLPDGDGTLGEALAERRPTAASADLDGLDLARLLDGAMAACLKPREIAVLRELVMAHGSARTCAARWRVSRARVYEMRDTALRRLRRRLKLLSPAVAELAARGPDRDGGALRDLRHVRLPPACAAARLAASH